MSIVVRRICEGRRALLFRALLFALGISAFTALAGCGTAITFRFDAWEDRTVAAGSLWDDRKEPSFQLLHDEDQPRYPDDFEFETSTPLVTIVGQIDLYYGNDFLEIPAILMIDASDFPHNAWGPEGVDEFELIRFSSGQWFVASIFAGQRDIAEIHFPEGQEAQSEYLLGCTLMWGLLSAMNQSFSLDLTDVDSKVPVYVGHISFHVEPRCVPCMPNIDVVVQDRGKEFEAEIESLVGGVPFNSRPATLSESCS